MKSGRLLITLLIVVALGILITYGVLRSGMHSTNPAEEGSQAQVAETNTVEIKNYAYSPQKIRVKKGTTVTWTNNDLVPHTVTMVDKGKEGPDSELFSKGGKYSYTFNEAGIYDYYCKPHPYMKASVEVY